MLFSVAYNNPSVLKSIVMMFLAGSLILQFSCEKVVYIETPLDKAEEQPRVTVSIYSSKVENEDGEPCVTVRGKVKNFGPGSINNIKVIVQTNMYDSKIAAVKPSTLEEEEILHLLRFLYKQCLSCLSAARQALNS